MTTKNPHRVSHGRSRLVLAAAAAACLAASAYAAFTAPIEHALPLLRTASAHALMHRGAAAGPGVGAPVSAVATREPWVPVAGEASFDGSHGPRECRLDAGIDTACTFL